MTQVQQKPATLAKIRLAGAIAIVAAVVVFAILNAATVEINFLFARAEMPRFFLIAGVFVLGVASGWLIRGRRLCPRN